MRRWLRRRRLDLDHEIAVALDDGRPSGWFEPMYAATGADPRRLPWSAGRPHPYVQDWLEHPVVAPPGPRALVVGCGLGDDAALLAEHGYEVVAFDVAPSAVASARRRFRGLPVDFRVADLLAAPEGWRGAFDLVVEVDTVPWLPGVVREAAMAAIGSLVAERGVLVAVTLLATAPDAPAATQGPPWPQAPSELAAYAITGLVRIGLEHGSADEQGRLGARLTLQRPRGVAPDGPAPGGPQEPGGVLPLA